MLPETTRLAKAIQVLSPPSTKRDRIVSVDDDLLPNEIHVEHSATSVSQADPSTDAEPSYAGPALVAIGDRDLDPVRSDRVGRHGSHARSHGFCVKRVSPAIQNELHRRRIGLVRLA
jgi:hypothetical protein